MTAAPHKTEARLTFKEVRDLQETLGSATALDILDFALSRFDDRLAIACSFSAEDIVLIDLAMSLKPDVRVFSLDTGRLPEETYAAWAGVKARWDISIETLFPAASDVNELVTDIGPNGFYDSLENRRRCCDVRKVQPLRSCLAQLDGWVTGLRRDQSGNRARVHAIEIDLANGGLVKFNPLAAWSDEAVWQHIKKHDLPYNTLHDRGYPSIGCAPCTRSVQPGDDPRSGRWWWESAEENECGIHQHVVFDENENG